MDKVGISALWTEGIAIRGDQFLTNNFTWKAPLVSEAHVHATVEHNVLAAHREQQTTPAHILSSPEGRDFYIWHRFIYFCTAIVDKHCRRLLLL